MINPAVVEGQIAGGTSRASAVRCSNTSSTTPKATRYLDLDGLPGADDRRVPVIEYGHVEAPGPGPRG